MEPMDPPPSLPTSPAPSPFLKHLDLRQVAAPAAQPAVQPAAGAQAQPAAKPAAQGAGAAAPVAQPAPNQPAVAAPAPAVGVGGAGAAPAGKQPGANEQANPVTTIMVDTFIGGKKTQVPKVYTQTFAQPVSSIPVKKGVIGMGTLTGSVGVVKTQNAKSDAVPMIGKGRIPVGEIGVVFVMGIATLGGGLGLIARI